MSLRAALATAVLATLLAGCPRRRATDADLAAHPVRQAAFWAAWRARPLPERVDAAPAELAEYLRMDNEVNGFTAVPAVVPLTPELRADAQAAIAELPAALQAMLSAKLVAVMPVRGLGSSGLTDVVRDATGKAVAAFVVFDVDFLGRRANDWLTFKERSPFAADPQWRLEAQLEEPANDTPRQALAFLLLHEFGHAVAFDTRLHPAWSAAPDGVVVESYPFLATSWGVKNGRWARRADQTAPLPGPVVYYKEQSGKPSASQLPAYYDWLARTDFVTLYAATNPFDDFAEALATYVHTEVLHRPFRVRLYKDGVLEREVSACWQEARCAAKRAQLAAFLGP